MVRKFLTIFLTAAGVLSAQTKTGKIPPPPAAQPGAPPVIIKTPAAKTAPAAAKPNPNDPVVFRVGGESMTKSQFEQFVALLPENQRKQFEGSAKRQLAEKLGELKALAQEARRLGLDKKPEVQQQLRIQADNVLASMVFQQLIEDAKKNESALRDYYDSHPAEFEKTRARHILVRFQGSRVPLKEGQKDLTDAEAQAKAQQLRDRIVKGEDFAAVAKAESDDTGSGANGGDLGEFGHGAMVPEFEKAAFEQPVNEVGAPVRSMFGWHVIQVQQRGPQPFDKVRSAIEQKVAQPAAQNALEQLKLKSNIILDETYFGKK